MKALVIAESAANARELCSGARTLADEVTLVALVEGDWGGMADTCLRIAVPEGSVLDDAYETLNALADEQAPGIVLAEPTTRILGLVGRLAAHLGTAVMTDVISIADGAGTSLYFGGAGVRTVKAVGSCAVYTVGAGVFDAQGAHGTDEVRDVTFTAPATAVRKTGSEALEKVDVNLPGASVVVCAGRGFAEEQDLELARDLCAKVGGELGCTRPLTEGVDWMPRETYIGVSGLMLSPKVYIACGVSGQMQHMVGCNRSNTIFAVNKDKNAPVFRQCDYGLVGDIKDVLPALVAAL